MRRANTIKCDGFTLVELLMVIMIVGALASIAIPRYAEYRAKANRAQCEANRYHIEMEERAHYLDHGSPSLLIDNIYRELSAAHQIPSDITLDYCSSQKTTVNNQYIASRIMIFFAR